MSRLLGEKVEMQLRSKNTNETMLRNKHSLTQYSFNRGIPENQLLNMKEHNQRNKNKKKEEEGKRYVSNINHHQS